MKQTQQGFTLIELMIVVAIIGILAAVALPAYQDYVAKSKITSIVASASAGKSAIFDRYNDLGKMPDAAGTATTGIDVADSTTEGFYKLMEGLKYSTKADFKYTKDSDTKATFQVKLDAINGNVNGKTLDFIFEDTGGELSFKCSNTGTIKAKYLPAQCS